MRAITRRTFLKGVAAIGGSVILVPRQALALEDFPGWPHRFGMLTDITRCIGCRRCEGACNEANHLPPPRIPFDEEAVFEEKRRPYVADAQSYTVVNRYRDPKRGDPVYRKAQCMHCEEPACVSACLVGAMKKSPEGPVIYNEDICIGCRYCITACPFYIPAYEYSEPLTPKVQKCFMCYHRIQKGLAPACAEVCPVEALTFGKRSDLIKVARERINKEPQRYVDHIYGEHEAGGTGWLYISGVPFEQLDFPMDLGKTALPTLTRDFLSMVPLVLVAWPALFGGIYTFANHRELPAEGKTPVTQEGDGQP